MFLAVTSRAADPLAIEVRAFIGPPSHWAELAWDRTAGTDGRFFVIQGTTHQMSLVARALAAKWIVR